ncbi:MAG: hypothetical protein EPO32_11745 [Anaerolineae bacterium]|nr:MAG: hypothetical protein EPO32_11745 [Anaerolineae bacterium]
MPTGSLVEVFLFSFAVGLGAVISPGPVSTAIVSQAPRAGWRVGPLVATGHSLMEAVLVVLIALGLAAGMARPGVQLALALGGGLLLLWMGGGMLWALRQGKVRIPGVSAEGATLTPRQMIRLGMLTTLSNPFWYAWWVTVAAGYLGQAQQLGTAAVAAFYFGHISADYAWDTALSTLVGAGRRWITEPVYRGLVGLSGAFFIYLGLVFLRQAALLVGR